MKRLFEPRTIKLTLVTLAALVSIPLAIIYNNYAIANKPPLPAKNDPVSLPKVTVVEVMPGSHEAHFQVSGEALPRYELSLVAEVSGRILQMSDNFEAGARVAKGDTLLKIDAVDYLAAVARAQQALAEAQYKLEQEERLAFQAERDWKRAGIDEQPTDLALRRPQLASAQAELVAVRAELAKAQRDLEDTELTAPFDAVVANRSVSLGGFVSAGAAIAELYSIDSIRVTLPLSAEQWQLISKSPTGIPEQVTLESVDANDVFWQARVVRMEGFIDRDTRQRGLVVEVSTPLEQQAALLPGSFVTADIQVAAMPDLIQVPSSSMSADGYLWTVDADKLLQRHRVNPIFAYDNHLFVKAFSGNAIKVVRHPLVSYLPGTAVQAEFEESLREN